MFTFATDYYILVAVAATGALQVAASLGGLNGLLFLKRPVPARTLGIALIVAAFVWFFAVEERNINDYEGGLDAPTQTCSSSWSVDRVGLHPDRHVAREPEYEGRGG